MTHPNNPDLLNTVLQLLATQDTSRLAEGLRLLLNEAMRQERSTVFQAQPFLDRHPTDTFLVPMKQSNLGTTQLCAAKTLPRH
jgi:hypothetical protein